MNKVNFIKNKTDLFSFNKLTIWILFSFMLLITTQSSYAQLFKGEIILGGNLSQMEGDRVAGYKKFGFRGGLGVMLPFHFKQNSETKPFAVSMEILFNQKGARQKNRNYDPNDTVFSESTNHKFDYLLNFNYVSVPVLFHFTDRELYTLSGGFAYNRLVTSKEVEKDVVQTYDTVSHFNASDFTVVLDFRCRIWQQLKAGIRFEYSLVPIRTRMYYTDIFHTKSETRKQYNNTLSLYIVYIFNEKRVDIDKEKKKANQIYYY